MPMPLSSAVPCTALILWVIVLMLLISHSHQDKKSDAAAAFELWPYVFGKKSYDDRQDEILNQMRRSMFLDVKGDIIPKDFHAGDPLYINNLEGRQFRIDIDPIEKFHMKDELEAKKPITDAEGFMRTLRGLCLPLHRGWWSYEWCSRKEIRQYHLENVGGKKNRNPDWSLGIYESSRVERYGGDHQNKSASILKIIDTFNHGQHCDETNSGRRSEVHMQCCADSEERNNKAGKAANIQQQMMNQHQQLVNRNTGQQDSKNEFGIKLEDVKEQTICNYHVKVRSYATSLRTLQCLNS